MIGHTYLEDGKYFIPDIEDFCIGYECEVCWSAGYTEEFYPFEVRLQNDDFIYAHDLEELCIAADDGYAYIRTKCLDKEDIESLGWKYTGKSLDIWFEKEGYFQQATWSSRKAILHYNLEDMFVHISLEDIDNRETIYNGKLPSKNELKKLMKLLGI